MKLEIINGWAIVQSGELVMKFPAEDDSGADDRIEIRCGSSRVFIESHDDGPLVSEIEKFKRESDVGLNYWGHEVLDIDPVGLGNGQYGARFNNSWGTSWGQNGRAVGSVDVSSVKNSTRKRKEPAAEAAYNNAHIAARYLVERIRELLFDLPAPDNDEFPINWAHVGSIGEVNNRLAAIVEFMSPTKDH